MATKRLKRPRDPVSLAKLVGDIATGQTTDQAEDRRSSSAVEMGSKGGTARAAKLSKKRRAEIAKKAAAARWQRR